MSKAEQLAHKLDFEYADNGAGYNTEWTKGLQEAAALLRAQDALLRQALEALENMKNPDFDAVESFEQCEAAKVCEETHERMNSSFQGAADEIRKLKEETK